ncbi:NAD(P)/FAD-dependent oxidoreductase [Calorimonas adulescens]|uniref:FAD-binding protein n=1 Tax=Calorimonas adulescens TaxID=2606906 RepID=A0A5D8QFT9_9THEO|nr:FAD-dependent oxidoreductase [Calorimonas adulescens]TZE83014.1 FAD-binding protein [Calorimonas adulescens]
MYRSIVVIGGGPAGLGAAVEAKKLGIDDVLILERDRELGGILNQCIHNGFGLQEFNEELTGPEYADRFIKQVKELGIEYKLDTMVLDITPDRKITAVNSHDGLIEIEAGAVILAMGCRERPRGAINIPGSRPAGIFTAGTAQRFANMEGYLPGKEVVILGSGDIGLIMARRFTLEGAKVKAVCEIMPYSSGLKRNIVQCLDDFGIPLLLRHTVVRIHGKDRVEGVTIAEVDDKKEPIPGTEKYIPCDTLLLSVGLIPENELSKKAGVILDKNTGGAYVWDDRETTTPGIFACGNVLQVHDLVDNVTDESRIAAHGAVRFLKEGEKTEPQPININPGDGVRYVVPQRVKKSRVEGAFKMFLRVTDVYENAKLVVDSDKGRLFAINKRRLSPGEMEYINVTQRLLNRFPDIREITIKVERG